MLVLMHGCALNGQMKKSGSYESYRCEQIRENEISDSLGSVTGTVYQFRKIRAINSMIYVCETEEAYVAKNGYFKIRLTPGKYKFRFMYYEYRSGAECEIEIKGGINVNYDIHLDGINL